MRRFRRFARRRTSRRRITPRRFFRARKSLKIARSLVHSYVRNTVLTPLTAAGNNAVFTYTWEYNTMNSAQEFSVIYEYFKINAVRWTFYVDQGDSIVGTNLVTSPQLTTAIVRDVSGLTISTENHLLEYRTARTKCLMNGIKHTVYLKHPSFENLQSFQPPYRGAWFPTLNQAGALSAEVFQGLKFLFKGLNTNTTIRVYRKDYLQFKGIR